LERNRCDFGETLYRHFRAVSSRSIFAQAEDDRW
jgi:hypothetical protein